MTSKPRKSATPKKTAAPVEVTPVSSWKVQNPPLELPSGKSMKVRKVGFQAFMKAGLIPNSLLSTVQSSIDRGVEPQLDLSAIASDTKQMQDMLDMVDDVICFVAMDPPVNKTPKSEADRDEDLLYVDEIDDEDKMFIFGVCTGGTRDVEQFRNEQANSLAALQ
jgi:hypothetical protein